MPLENLLILIEKLQKRIDSHGDALRQSEALTRYALIDPLLRELGWDIEDPDVVVPEYRVQNNQIADYVLYYDGDPVIVIESKKLAEPLQGGKALDQGILYCAYTGAGYFTLTDGNSWELYESGKTSPITSFDLTNESAAGTCLKALALWRPSVIAGQIAVGATPVIGLPEKPGDNALTIRSSKEKTEVSQTQELIDINQATAKDLERLPSIGPGTALLIVDYRDENGPFKQIEDITKVRDIGTKTFEKLSSHITIT
ncbi:MAG: hypothetical protein F4Z86_09160 [Gemmatimonadetes bacterium]|nr:hypothetical protein [Gemmatimonadota bacterium]MYB56246.1 hypothetical protein [Gemmatimonadota bacterium]